MIIPASTPNMIFKVQVKDSDWCLGLAVLGLISCSFIVEGGQREKSISKYTDPISPGSFFEGLGRTTREINIKVRRRHKLFPRTCGGGGGGGRGLKASKQSM